MTAYCHICDVDETIKVGYWKTQCEHCTPVYLLELYSDSEGYYERERFTIKTDKMIYYRQCHLRKGTLATTTWLPEKYAKRGKYLKLKGIDGWKVISVGNTRKPEDLVNEHSQDYKHQREASDI